MPHCIAQGWGWSRKQLGAALRFLTERLLKTGCVCVKGEKCPGSSVVASKGRLRCPSLQPNRTYYLEDPEGYALTWCKAIDEVRKATYSQAEDAAS